MIDAARRRPQRRGWAPTNLDADVRRAADEHGQEDFILGDERGVVDGVVGVDGGVVARRAARGAGARGVQPVPEDEFLGVDGEGGGVAAFVGVDVVGEDVAPVVVRHVVDVALGAGGDAGPDGADVVRFAVVVPGDDLWGTLVSGFARCQGVEF